MTGYLLPGTSLPFIFFLTSRSPYLTCSLHLTDESAGIQRLEIICLDTHSWHRWCRLELTTNSSDSRVSLALISCRTPTMPPLLPCKKSHSSHRAAGPWCFHPVTSRNRMTVEACAYSFASSSMSSAWIVSVRVNFIFFPRCKANQLQCRETLTVPILSSSSPELC